MTDTAALPAPPEDYEERDIVELRIFRTPRGDYTLVDPRNRECAHRLCVDEALGSFARWLYSADRRLQFARPINEALAADRKYRAGDVYLLAMETVLREIDEATDFPTPPLAFLSRRDR